MGDNINVEKLSLIWLDDSANESQDNIIGQQQLRLVDSNFKMFKNKNECEEHIKSQSADARITFIVNGRLGQQIVPEIHSLAQIVTIYIFCMNKEAHLIWSANYNKVFL
jgi:hypothetical protein